MGKIIKDHLGNKFHSLKSMLDCYGIPKKTYIWRYQQYPDKDIGYWLTFGWYIHPNHRLTDDLVIIRSIAEDFFECDYQHNNIVMSRDTICKILVNNFIEKTGGADTNGILGEVYKPISPKCIPCTDHLGNTYVSRASMLQKYGISDVAFDYRLNKLGWSLEKTLTEPAACHLSTAIACTDHLGNEFPTKAAMAAHWGIPRATFFRRQRDGWDLEKSLTEPIRTTFKNHFVKDHLGNEYNNIEAMCIAHNITKQQYLINIRNGLNIKDSLTKTTKRNDKICDHLGNEFASTNEMCRHYNTNKNALRSRLELGWTLKECLEYGCKKQNWHEWTDHNGKVFPSMKDMLKYHGVAEHTFKHRKKIGRSLEECLFPEDTHKKHCVDHLGNHFETIKDMCNHWELSTSTYYTRVNRNGIENLEWILTTIQPSKYKTFNPDLPIVKSIEEGSYYEVLKDGQSVIMTKELVWKYHDERMNITR